MPKSKHRKNHSKKLNERKQAIQNEKNAKKNRLIKAIKKHQLLQTSAALEHAKSVNSTETSTDKLFNALSGNTLQK